MICGGDVIYGVHESATSPQKKVPAPAGSHIAFVIVEVQLEYPTCKVLDDTFPYYVPRLTPIKINRETAARL